jgi:hypothetical protein
VSPLLGPASSAPPPPATPFGQPFAFKVEIAFTTGPDDPSPAWVDVTNYAEAAGSQLSIVRGRPDMYSHTNAGTMTVTLDNSDGRFTAGHAGSPYYPNVVLNRRIRVSASRGGGPYSVRFTGFISAWPLQWSPVAQYAHAQITAVDRLARVGRFVMPANIVTMAVNQCAGTADYWPLGDPSTALVPARIHGTHLGNIAALSANSALTFGSGTGVGTDGLTAMQVTDSGLKGDRAIPYYLRIGSSPTDPTQGGIAVSAFVRYPGAVTGDSFILASFTDRTGTTFEVRVDSGSIVCSHPDANGGQLLDTQGSGLFDGATHHVYMLGFLDIVGATYPNRFYRRYYIDGVLVASNYAVLGGSGNTFAPILTAQLIARTRTIRANPVTATYSHIALGDARTTPTQVTGVAQAGAVYETPETSLDRWARLVKIAGIVDSATYGGPGSVNLSPLKASGGENVLGLMQQLEDTEAGLLFADVNGVLTFRTRLGLRSPPLLASLSSAQIDPDLTFILDDTGLINDYTATAGTGNVYHFIDYASVAAYGTYSGSSTVETLDNYEAEAFAQNRITKSVPQVRVPWVTVDLMTLGNLADSIWAGELVGAIIRLTNLPGQAPGTSSYQQVAGYTEVYDVNTYKIQMNTQPASPPLLTLDDAVLGILDAGNSIAY